MWRVVLVIVGIWLALAIVGAIIGLLRWLLGLGLLILIVAALIGAFGGRSREP